MQLAINMMNMMMSMMSMQMLITDAHVHDEG